MTLSFPGVVHRAPRLRKYALALAFALGLAACWLTIPEALRASGSPLGAAEAAFLRGDLWADYAIFERSKVPVNYGGAADEHTRSIEAAALAAVKRAPVNARIWLLLATLNAHSQPQKAAAFLKLSFYTGPAEDVFIPQYLQLLTALELRADDELQYITERQIEKVVSHHPELRPNLISAYRQTSLQNQVFIEAVVSRLDRAFGTQLRTSTP